MKTDADLEADAFFASFTAAEAAEAAARDEDAKDGTEDAASGQPDSESSLDTPTEDEGGESR